MPRTQKGSLYQVGGAEIWRIAGIGYLSGTPKKTSEDWPSEWFYMEDVPLPDPIRMGLPEFDNAPLKKRRSWRPWSPQEEDNGEVLYLMGRIDMLVKMGHAGPPFEPRRRPQAGKSGEPRSQNANNHNAKLMDGSCPSHHSLMM